VPLRDGDAPDGDRGRRVVVDDRPRPGAAAVAAEDERERLVVLVELVVDDAHVDLAGLAAVERDAALGRRVVLGGGRRVVRGLVLDLERALRVRARGRDREGRRALVLGDLGVVDAGAAAVDR